MSEEKPKPGFERQMVLIDSIREKQRACDHSLIMVNSGVIVCQECGALWIK